MKKTAILSVASVLLLLVAFAAPEADAANRGTKGRGQTIRDGSCRQSETGPWAAENQRGQVNGPYGNRIGPNRLQGSGPGPGDGTRPQPRDGTGFGSAK